MKKVLLLEHIHPTAAKIFRDAHFEVELLPGAMGEAELSEKIKDIAVLGIRSKTQFTKQVLQRANRLLAVGAFCIGTNQIDLEACQEQGVCVFNAPYSNTRSVVELAIGEIVMLMRNLTDKIRAMHEGKWQKSAGGSFELRSKKLGIIGYGNIGSQLSTLAEGMGMDVYYYDLAEKLALGNATKCDSMADLLKIADVVSLHVDGRESNHSFFGAEAFAQMKTGALFLNLSRGFVVDVEALAQQLKSGKIAGAALDVFPEEPKNNSEPFKSVLQNLPNVILTPHIGGSTAEAQKNIANFVPNQIINYIKTGNTHNSVNFPPMQLLTVKKAHRLLHIHKNMAGILAHINQILAKHRINIVGQYLKTNAQIGYVITDIGRAYAPEVIEELESIEGTIKLRVLY